MTALEQPECLATGPKNYLLAIDDEPKEIEYVYKPIEEISDCVIDYVDKLKEGDNKLFAYLENIEKNGGTILIVLDIMFDNDPVDNGFEVLIEFIRRAKIKLEEESRRVGIDFNIIIYTKANKQVRDKIERLFQLGIYVKGTDDFKFQEYLKRFFGIMPWIEEIVPCEVVTISQKDDIVLVKIEGNEGWHVERAIHKALVPPKARFAGGSFYLVTSLSYKYGIAQQTEHGVPASSVCDNSVYNTLKGLTDVF